MFTATIRRSVSAIAVTALIAGVAAPAFASDVNKPAPAEQAKEKTLSKNPRVCIESRTTGSRISHSECKKRDEWIKETGIDPLENQ